MTQTYEGLPPRLFAHQALLDCATSSVMTHTSVRHLSPLRTAPKKTIERLSSFFVSTPREGNVDCINCVLFILPFCVQAHNVTLLVQQAQYCVVINKNVKKIYAYGAFLFVD